MLPAICRRLCRREDHLIVLSREKRFFCQLYCKTHVYGENKKPPESHFCICLLLPSHSKNAINFPPSPPRQYTYVGTRSTYLARYAPRTPEAAAITFALRPYLCTHACAQDRLLALEVSSQAKFHCLEAS